MTKSGQEPELTVGLMIGLGRRMLEGDAHIRSGNFAGWQPTLYSLGLLGKTVGIVGMGKLGRALAPRLAGFGCRLIYSDPIPLPADLETQWQINPVEFAELLATSDYVVLMVPLQPSTLHLVGRDAIAAMKPDSFLINPCRGSVVDESAVADAIASGHLAGYAADVFEMEDWARVDRPCSIDPRLLQDRKHTFLTPHLGSAIEDVRREIAMEAAVNLVQALQGKTPERNINLL